MVNSDHLQNIHLKLLETFNNWFFNHTEKRIQLIRQWAQLYLPGFNKALHREINSLLNSIRRIRGPDYCQTVFTIESTNPMRQVIHRSRSRPAFWFIFHYGITK